MASPEFAYTPQTVTENAQQQAAVLLRNMAGIEAVGIREGLVDAYVDLKRIHREAIAIDDSHVVELQSLFADESAGSTSRTGQLVPILLTEVAAEPKLYIADGFHRTEALHRIGAGKAYASIKPDCTPEALHDLRIRATASHKTVQFARVGEWINTTWAATPWQAKLSATQAFLLRSQNDEKRSLTGSRLGLAETDITAIVAWIDDKSAQWKLSARTIYQNLAVADKADPQLVRQTRSGRSLGKILSPQQLRRIAQALPNEYPMQQLAASAAVQFKLSSQETGKLANRLAEASSLEDAEKMLNNLVLAQSSTANGRPQLRAPTMPLPAGAQQPEGVVNEQVLRNILFEQAVAIAGLELNIAQMRHSGSTAVNVTQPQNRLQPEQRANVARTLLKMNPLQRKAYLLTAYYQTSAHMISALFEEPLGTVQSELSKAQHLVEVAIAQREAAVNTVVAEKTRPYYTLVVNDMPRAEINWISAEGSTVPDDTLTGSIQVIGLQFGDNRVIINDNSGKPTNQMNKCGVLACVGLTNKEIGQVLFVTEDTVETYLRRLFESLQITNRSQIFGRYVDAGYFKITK